MVRATVHERIHMAGQVGAAQRETREPKEESIRQGGKPIRAAGRDRAEWEVREKTLTGKTAEVIWIQPEPRRTQTVAEAVALQEEYE